MTIRPEIIRYLRTHVGNYTDEALRERLLADGVSGEEVDGAFAIVNLTRPGADTPLPAPVMVQQSPLLRRAQSSAASRRQVGWGKRLVVFGAGFLLLGGVIAAEMALKKFRSPDTQKWLAGLQEQADALSGEPMRDALASKRSSGVRTSPASDAFMTYAQLSYGSLSGKKYSDAVRYADMALESWSEELHGKANRKSLMAIRARAYEMTGQNARALEQYEDMARIDPTDADAYNGRGRIYLNADDFASAVREAKRAVSAAPQRPEGYAIAAAAYSRLGSNERALQNFSKAIDRIPASDDGRQVEMLANLHYNRGVILANRKRYALAIKDIDRAVALSPQTGPYYRARAQVYRAMGKKALAALDDRRADEIASLGEDTGPKLGLGPTLPGLTPAKPQSRRTPLAAAGSPALMPSSVVAP